MPATPRLITLCAAIAFVTVAAGRRYAQPVIGELTVTPVSDVRPDAYFRGAESLDGRFVILTEYTGAHVRYDRTTRQWASLKGSDIWVWTRWSPDGRFLASAYPQPNAPGRYVWLVPMDASTGLPRATPRRISTRQGNYPSWSPDSRRIAFVSGQDSGRFRLVAVPFNGGEEEVLLDRPGGGSDVLWSPDGRYLYAGFLPAGGSARLLRVDIRTKRADSLPFITGLMLGFSSDGKRMAYHDGQQNQLVVTSPDDGRILERFRVPPGVTPTGWSRSTPNAFTAYQWITPAHVQRASLPDGAITSVTPVDSEAVGGVRFSPDGRRVAYVKIGLTGNRLVVADADGSNGRAVGGGGPIGQELFKWSPSGDRIAYQVNGPTRTIRVADLNAGTDRELLRPRNGANLGGAIAWRSDGRAIRYVSRPRGSAEREREVREVTLDGVDRLLVAAPIPAAEPLFSNLAGRPHFINDTLLLLKKDNGVDAVSLRTGSYRSLYAGSMRGASEFGISADGQWIAFGIWDNGKPLPMLLSLTTGEQRRIPYTLGAQFLAIYFHPDGRHLVAPICRSCPDVERWDIAVIPMNGDPTRVLTSGQPAYKEFESPSISPDGRSVVFSATQSYNTRIVTLTPSTSTSSAQRR